VLQQKKGWKGRRCIIGSVAATREGLPCEGYADKNRESRDKNVRQGTLLQQEWSKPLQNHLSNPLYSVRTCGPLEVDHRVRDEAVHNRLYENVRDLDGAQREHPGGRGIHPGPSFTVRNGSLGGEDGLNRGGVGYPEEEHGRVEGAHDVEYVLLRIPGRDGVGLRKCLSV
jgi:hypothetical protein